MRPCAGVAAAGGGHEGVDEALQGLVVLVDVDDLLAGEVAHADVDVEAAGAVDVCARRVEDGEGGLEAAEAGLVVVEDGSHALDGRASEDRAVGHELVV